MEVVTWPISKLSPNSRNPRTITSDQLERLKASLVSFPEMMQLRPVVVSPDGTILGGNMRYRAAKDLGWKEVPVIVASNISDAKRAEFIIRDNVGLGEWDFDMLANDWDIEQLSEWGVDVPAVDTEIESDGIPPVQENADPISKLGDVWILGEHRVMCGDSTKSEDVARLMKGEQAQLWLTDPPYNIAYEGKTSDKLTIANDSMPSLDFRAFLVLAFTNAYNSMMAGASFYIWHASMETVNFSLAVDECGEKVRQYLVWVKNAMVLGRQDYQWRHEPCLYGWKDGTHSWYSDRKQTTVLEFDRPTQSTEHPTMKPVDLFAYQMQNSSKRGDLVIDTFLGSGTTLIAAEQLGRRCYGMELDPKYVDVIVKRWETLTGRKAELYGQAT